MDLISSSKLVRLLSATMICLMIASTIIGSGIMVIPTKAAFPWEPLTLTATKTDDPYWGYYGGYHDLWEVVKSNLSNIGITLDTSYTTDIYTWWSRVWDRGWDKVHANGGWDLIMLEWWLEPPSLVPWFDSGMYGNATPIEGGFNIIHYNNTEADILLRRGMQASNATDKKDDLWKWQEAFIHDPPWVDIYNPRVYEIMGSYIEGYNPMVWWYDISHMTVNATTFNNTVTNVDRRAVGPNTTIYAVSETVWSLLPVYCDSYTEENLQTVQWKGLYRWTLKDSAWPDHMDGSGADQNATVQDWDINPDIADGEPIVDPEGTGDNKRIRVNIKQGIKWSDNVTLNVHDVLFTFNTCSLNLATGSTGYADFAIMIKNVTYHNTTAVDFYLNYEAPVWDFKSCLANDWGGGVIMPFHVLGGYMSNPWAMYSSKYNTDFAHPENWIPVTGPFEMTEIVVNSYAKYKRNPNYYGYNISIVGSPAWGPYNIDELIFEWVPDAAARLTKLKNNDIDFGEYPTAAVSEYIDLKNQTKWPNIRVIQYDYQATNAIWFNLDHPILSNRYVRQAIAHAIDYEHIFSHILPGWGIETAYRGLTHILDMHYYTDPVSNVTVHLYNDNLQPYQTNTTQAIEYMKMYYYAKDGTDYTQGPVGDADFSGKVGLDDFYRWVDWFGKTTGQITFEPGQDTDPDWDNSGFVEMPDFSKWPPRYNYYYPENSTIWKWSR